MSPSPRAKRSGVALVLVLSFLALITVLVLAFFSSVTTELASSGAAADNAATRQLADAAINVVMTQMVDGTKGLDANGAILSWASQPGMLRTYSAKGTPAYYYKLYSSDQMVVSGTGFNVQNEQPPNDWNSASNSDIYTDLNAPVVDAQGNTVYPILDPGADGRTPPAGGTVPIDPKDKLKVDGFSISANVPGYNSKLPEGYGNNSAPMPTRWLYMLQDGTLLAGVASGSSVSVVGATKTNPIVGRIAFWTDDETTKININTASEGTYWDVPRIYSREDMGGYVGASTNPQYPSLAICQPYQHEYQRYPGHPATTCLSPVLGNLLSVPFPYPANPTSANGNQLEPYYNLTPRIGLAALKGGGGSVGGTRQQDPNNPSAAIVTDTDRLYASVEELMFTPVLTGHARIPNTSSNAAPATITKRTLEQAKFFLTANSNAPEVTLFNTPRVAIWPVWEPNPTAANPTYKPTPFDNLMAFCSTIGTGASTNAYYFTRFNSRSMTGDLTPRNAALYRYLQTMTAAEIPGFGGNFLRKYPALSSSTPSDRDQILTYIYDYIRCTSLQDRSNGATPYTRSTAGTPAIFDNNTRGAGEVMPIRIGATQGFGRFYSISQANLLFYGSHKSKTSSNATAMRALLYFQFASPLQGLGCMRPSVTYRVTGLDQFKVTIGSGSAQSLNFPIKGGKYTLVNDLAVTDLSTFHGRSIGGNEGPTQGLLKKSYQDVNFPWDIPPTDPPYQFVSTTEVPYTDPKATTFTLLNNQNVMVEILKPEDNTVIQTIHLQFPKGEFLLPKYKGTEILQKNGQPAAYDFALRQLANPVDTSISTPDLINNFNTVVGLQVAGNQDLASETQPVNDTAGDTRMVEGLTVVPVNRFHADANYFTKGAQFAHGTVMSVGETFTGGKYGRLAPGLPTTGYLQSPESGYTNFHRQPDVPSRVTTSVKRIDPQNPRGPGGPGDWDTGMGDQKDGAYINKPDEGDSAIRDTVNNVIRIPYNLGYGAGYASANQTYFSPNRQVSSPMMFGSIPTGVQRIRPWQTLLFHSAPEDPAHPGALAPKDELLADLFWMPVVEPWAISQPFATTGKINMNYQIMPFKYITRQSGLYGVLKATKFAAIPSADVPFYKPIDPSGRGTAFNANRRHPIDIAKTLAAFDKVFNAGDLFRSATQVCDIDLWPADAKPSSMASFWLQNALTGDNLREKPYADIYPRLTTKSNTFTVHVRVQALKKLSSTPPDQWVSGKDRVAGEYRGSSILERYIDVNDATLPDFATFDPANPQKTNIDPYYKMRVVSTKQFSP